MKIKTSYVVIITMFVAVIVLGMYKFGLFHCLQSWPEYKFLGRNIEELSNHLENNSIKLRGANSVDLFELLSRKRLSKTQKLYMFYGDKKHRFWFFPIGSKTYGLYVLVEDGKIIFFQEFVEIDSL